MKPLLIDIVGQKFGKLTVLKPVKRDKYGKIIYLCKCDCGTEKEIARASLIKNWTKSCGCLYKEAQDARLIDLKGKTFNNLIVIEKYNGILSKDRGDHCAYWLCKCICGNIKPISSRDLRSNRIKSCGCQNYNYIKRRKFEDPIKINAHNAYRKYSDEDLSFEDFLVISQQNCFYCNAPPQQKYNTFTNRKTVDKSVSDGYVFYYNGIDRIDPGRGHSRDNIVACCKHCNTAKLDLSFEEFKDKIRKIYEVFVKPDKKFYPELLEELIYQTRR